MQDAPRTLVTFKSAAFNATEPRDYFINECCFGDDLAKWLIRELRAQGISTDEEPGQEDFGWHFSFRVDGVEHTMVLGHRPGDQDEEGEWLAWVERNCGFVASLFGGRKRGVSRAATAPIHTALSGSEQVRDVRWHHRADFDRGVEECGQPEP